MNACLRSLFALALGALAFAFVGSIMAQPGIGGPGIGGPGIGGPGTGGPGGGGGQGASIQFRNDTKLTVIVQGTSTMNGMLRRGQPMLMQPGRTNTEFNVPPGFRVYSVYDANQPTQVLVRDKAIMVVPGRDVSLTITQSPGKNQQITIIEMK